MQIKNIEKLRTILRTILEVSDGVPVEFVQQITCRRWDSLAQVTMVAAIEGEFKVCITGREYERLTSFSAIQLLLEEKGL